MKYNSPSSSSYNSPSSGSVSCSESAKGGLPLFVSKELSPIIYEFLEWTKNGARYDICWGNEILTRESVYKISKELSDNNIGQITFGEYNTLHPICIRRNKTAWDMRTQFRVLLYSSQKELTTTLIEDIQEMAKEGYWLFNFQHSFNEHGPEYLYCAKFIKN